MKTTAPILPLLLALLLGGAVTLTPGCDGVGPEPEQADGGPAVDAASAPTPPPAAVLLARHLTGKFDSADQSATDRSYYEIHLTVCPVSAPELGTSVLYVEQAQAAALDAPYRQRLYVIEAGEPAATRAVSRVFELADPSGFVSLCDRAEARTVTAAEAVERAGCAVFLDWSGERFEGGTEGHLCASSLNGAAYTVSSVILDAREMRSWDRGYDQADQQVWGAVKGPYIFVRRTPLEP